MKRTISTIIMYGMFIASAILFVLEATARFFPEKLNLGEFSTDVSYLFWMTFLAGFVILALKKLQEAKFENKRLAEENAKLKNQPGVNG